MPVEIQFRSNPEGIVFVYSGTVTGQDIISVNEEIKDREECVYQLSDFRAIDGVKMSPKELHKIAIQDCSVPFHFKLEKMAIVGT